jgi:hypothetical protein
MFAVLLDVQEIQIYEFFHIILFFLIFLNFNFLRIWWGICCGCTTEIWEFWGATEIKFSGVISVAHEICATESQKRAPLIWCFLLVEGVGATRDVACRLDYHCRPEEPNHWGEEPMVEWQFSMASFDAQEAASFDWLQGMEGKGGASGGRTLSFHPSRQRGNTGKGYCLRMKFHFYSFPVHAY